MPVDNLSTTRVGRLTVIRPTGERRHGSIMYECLCDCGNTVIVTASNLRIAHTRSCGCLPHKRHLNLSGQRFGRLVALERVGTAASGETLWLCRCDCGELSKVRISCLRGRTTVSCGCSVNVTHRLSKTPAYHVWHNMNQRCSDPEDPNYKNYGARGITVCERWQNVESFCADMGQPPKGLSIERINNDKGYWCGGCDECMKSGRDRNCRWDTAINQNRNNRRNHLLTARGRTMTLIEWVIESGISKSTILNRLDRGWSEERAVTVRPQGLHSSRS